MLYCGIDIGTSSSKGVVVDEHGTVQAQATQPHTTSTPRPQYYEHDAEKTWWADVCAISRKLTAEVDATAIGGVCVSGIGPGVLITDAAGEPLRPAILYGIDMRAEREIEQLTAALGVDEIVAHSGNPLTTQAVGPKLAWLAAHEPELWARARRWFNASSYAAFRLTGEYVLDRYTASAADPLYDVAANEWWEPAWADLDQIERPRLAWSDEQIGTVHGAGAEATGFAEGTPVLAGTVDAVSEGYSVGSHAPGDTVIMYGSTLFFVQVLDRALRTPDQWAATGRVEGTFSLSAGMSTAGLLTQWFADLSGVALGDLSALAEKVPPVSHGLVALPYFSGERTPIQDPGARGALVGLTLRHSRAEIFRAVLEGVAYSIRHNLESMTAAGAAPQRLFAVGGGSVVSLWPQIVSDVTGMPQVFAPLRVGASYGDARMCADAAGVDTSGWNKAEESIEPGADRDAYERGYEIYRALYPALAEQMHALGRLDSDD